MLLFPNKALNVFNISISTDAPTTPIFTAQDFPTTENAMPSNRENMLMEFDI